MPLARWQSGGEKKGLSQSALQPRTSAGLAVATWPVMAWSGLDPAKTTRTWWTCVVPASVIIVPFGSRTGTRKASSVTKQSPGSVFASSSKGCRRPSIRGIAAQGERGYARKERSVVGREVSMDGPLMAHDRESESKNRPGILSGSFWQTGLRGGASRGQSRFSVFGRREEEIRGALGSGAQAIEDCRSAAFREHHGQSLAQGGDLRSLKGAEKKSGIRCAKTCAELTRPTSRSCPPCGGSTFR